MTDRLDLDLRLGLTKGTGGGAAPASYDVLPTVGSAPLRVWSTAELMGDVGANLAILRKSTADASEYTVVGGSDGEAVRDGTLTSFITSTTGWKQVYDQSGNAGHMIQTATGSQPYYFGTTNDIDGHMCIVAGTNTTGGTVTRYLEDTTLTFNPKNFTIISVFAAGGGPIDHFGLWGQGAASGGFDRVSALWNTNTAMQIMHNNFITGPRPPRAARLDIFAFTDNGTNTKMRTLGGTTSTTGTTLSTDLTGHFWGRSSFTSGTSGMFHLHSQIVYPALSDADAQLVMDMLEARF